MKWCATIIKILQGLLLQRLNAGRYICMTRSTSRYPYVYTFDSTVIRCNIVAMLLICILFMRHWARCPPQTKLYYAEQSVRIFIQVVVKTLSSRVNPRSAILRQYLIRMITFLQFIRHACFSYHSTQLIVNTGVYFLWATGVTNIAHARRIARVH